MGKQPTKPSWPIKLLALLIASGIMVGLMVVIGAMVWPFVFGSSGNTRSAGAQKSVEAVEAERSQMKQQAARSVPIAKLRGQAQSVEMPGVVSSITPTTLPVEIHPFVSTKTNPVEKSPQILLARVQVTAPDLTTDKLDHPLLATLKQTDKTVSIVGPYVMRSFTPATQPGETPQPVSLRADLSEKPPLISLTSIRGAVVLPTRDKPNQQSLASLMVERQPSDDAVAIKSVALRSSSLRDAPSAELANPDTPSTGRPELLQPVRLSSQSQHTEVAELAGWPTTQPAGSTAIPLAKLDRIKLQIPPPLEEQRERDEARITREQDIAKVVTGFECSTPLEVEKLSATHFRVSIRKPTARNWFMFRLEGVKGKTVRVDIQNAPLNKWWSLNPVFSDVPSIDELEAFAVKSPAQPMPRVKALNGPLLPDTSGQNWQYISNVWMGEGTYTGTYSFVQRYESDGVYVAMRCPYTVEYNAKYVDSLKGRPSTKIVNIGKSENGHPLTIIQIGDADPATVPCLVIYAREHGNEHDTSWAVQGAIDFLSSNAPAAIQLRKNLTLIAIPVLDPDAAAASIYEGITEKFVHSADYSPEAIEYANFFKKWVDDGNRLDLTIDLHNVESAEGEHIFCPLIEPAAKRAELSNELHAQFMRSLADADYSVSGKPLHAHTAPFRLGGYLAQMYGPLFMPYELNSQQRSRHLTLEELRNMGRLALESSSKFLVSDAGNKLTANVATVRRLRDDRMARFGSALQKRGVNSALQIEWILWRRVLMEKANGTKGKDESNYGKVEHD